MYRDLDTSCQRKTTRSGRLSGRSSTTPRWSRTWALQEAVVPLPWKRGNRILLHGNSKLSWSQFRVFVVAAKMCSLEKSLVSGAYSRST